MKSFEKDEIVCLIAVKKFLLIFLEQIRPEDDLSKPKLVA
jgi:hypothetical protein